MNAKETEIIEDLFKQFLELSETSAEEVRAECELIARKHSSGHDTAGKIADEIAALRGRV